MQKIFIIYLVKVAVWAIGKRNVTNENVKKKCHQAMCADDSFYMIV